MIGIISKYMCMYERVFARTSNKAGVIGHTFGLSQAHHKKYGRHPSRQFFIDQASTIV
jgi:hypothetical protein